MIELRWFEYEYVINDFIPAAAEIRKKLQYRIVQNPMELGLQEPIWSAWFDVPTEKI